MESCGYEGDWKLLRQKGQWTAIGDMFLAPEVAFHDGTIPINCLSNDAWKTQERTLKKAGFVEHGTSYHSTMRIKE
ncbi:hypothetical protein vseg_011606 [Gypsophila vaccaria]